MAKTKQAAKLGIRSGWWTPGTLKGAHISVGSNGVLSKSSEDIAKSKTGGRQIDSFAEIAPKKKR